MRYFFFLLLLAALPARAQVVTAYQLLPANATANDNLRLVLTLSYGGCTRSIGYDVTRSGNSLAIKGCYPAVAIAMPCGGSDTIQLGRLPAGTYTVATTTYFSANNTASCSSNSIATGFPSATGSFTVGLALASRTEAPAWQVSPTVLPATASTLCFSSAPALQQLSIYDVTGREQARFNASDLTTNNNLSQVQLPALPPAIYLLRATDSRGQTHTQRFVRQ